MLSGLSDILNQIVNLFQWWIVIAPWEGAIRVRRGNKIKVLGPGIHMRVPALDRFFVQTMRKRYMNTPTQTVTTLDRQAVTVSGGTAYKISDIGALYNSLSAAEDVIQIETMALVTEYIATRYISDITPDKIQNYVGANLRLERYGLTDVEFCVTDFVVVKTYRIINSNPKDWSSSAALTVDTERRMQGIRVPY